MDNKEKIEILRKFSDCGVIMTSHGFDRIITHNLNTDEILRTVRNMGVWLVTDEFLTEFMNGFGKYDISIREQSSRSFDTKGVESKKPEIEPQIQFESKALDSTAKLSKFRDQRSRIEASMWPSDEVARTYVREAKLLRHTPKVSNQTLEQKEEPSPENLTVKVEWTKQIFAKEINSELKIYDDTDITGRSTCEGKLDDFIEYFNQKYINLREILRDRESLLGTIPIDAIKKQNNENIKIIAMVKDKRKSKSGFKFLDIEDPTGEISVLIPNDNRQLNELYDKILLDEVIGIQGRINNDFLIAAEIAEPELPIDHKTISAEEPVHAALISDIHVGNYLFLEKEFNNFINWLNLNGSRSEISEKIKYIVVAGDLVDGIGIYPEQEKELVIPDIYKQYEFLATLLEKIPDYIEIILAMGNHDAVRNAEPQPRLEKDIAGRLYELPNVHITGNPVMLSLHGVKTLVYHGTSLDTIIGNISGCTYSRPEIAMVEYLKKRYMIPMYGNDQISPEKKDYLIITEIPDILHSGHVHTNGYTNYRGVRVINSGTWQGRTKYQEQLGHIPTPCKVPIINLQNHEVSILHFD